MKYWYILWMAYVVGTTTLQELFIIVPGTWSTNQPWYAVNGDFFESLQQTLPSNNYQLIWFRWLAHNSDKHRKQGVRELAHMIRELPSTTVIHVIAHSHGVNVALGASQLLAHKKSSRRIQTLYALGAPIHEEEYAPNMHIIQRIYNLYSLNDPIQTIWGYQRAFRPHQEIYNIRVFINDHEPTHEELHNPIIARWLTMLPLMPCPHQATIFFYQNKPPTITENTDQDRILEQEKQINISALIELRKRSTPAEI